MNDLYDIPKRLKRKNGFFGSILPIDIGISAGLMFVGFMFIMTLSNIVGIAIMGVCAAIAYFGFIFKDQYDENMRIKFMRMLKFTKSQKTYYYYRGTKPYLKK